MTGRARARDLDLAPGKLPAGQVNAITDVAGVRVGHATVIEGASIRTGVTAIVLDALLTGTADSKGSLPAGLAVYNGYGKMVGSTAREQGPGSGSEPVPDNDLDLIFTAAIEATEEAILNSLFMAVTTAGFDGHLRQAASLDYVQELVSGRATAQNVSEQQGVIDRHFIAPMSHAGLSRLGRWPAGRARRTPCLARRHDPASTRHARESALTHPPRLA